MNQLEAGELLAIAGGFDNRKVDAMNSRAWFMVLRDHDYAECEAAIYAHRKDPETRHEYLKVEHILDRLEVAGRARGRDVEADVRSAKARGLIDASHPRREPLPKDVADRLQAARERDRDELLKHAPPELTR